MLEIVNLQDIEKDIGLKSDKNLNSLYQTLFIEIQTYLNLEPLYRKVKIKISNRQVLNPLNNEDIFSIGVNRYRKNDVLLIEIDEKYKKFIGFILFREIYNQYVPESLKNYELVQIVINKIIMTQLSKSPYLNEWRSLIREKIKNHDSLSKGVDRLFEYDRLEKVLKSTGTGFPYDPIQFFFKYLRENTSLISDKIEDIHEIFFQEFANYLSKSPNTDEIIETLRYLITIFYKKKNYLNLSNYKSYFQEFKKSGVIETELSLRKFNSNLDKIKNNSYVAPSYQLNWNTINISLISVFLRFNPLLNKAKIYKMIKKFPFFVAPKVSYDSFAVDLSGYMVIPKVYLDDFYRFIEKLEDFGYIIRHDCLTINANRHFVNLNYLKEYSKIHRILNLDHRQYDRRNEIEFKIDLGTYCNNKLSLLDFLVLDRIRFYSVSGLGFERKSDTLNEIKSDLLNGIITERAHIKNLRNNLKLFRGSIELTTEFMNFLKINQKFGFFYIKEILDTSLAKLDYIETVLSRNLNIVNYSQFQGFVENQNLSQQIEDKILIKNSYKKTPSLKELFTVFFQSKKLYKKKINHLKKFSDFINSCYKLKIFNITSIKKILTDKKIVDQLYKTKEAKIKKYYEKWKLYKINFQEIENIIDKFLNCNPSIIQPLLINTILFQEKDYLQLILIDSENAKKQIEKLKKYFPRVLINSTKALESNGNYIYVEISTPNMNKEEKEHFFSILYNNFKENLLYGKSYLWKGWIPALSRKNFYDFNNKQFFYTKDLYTQFFLYITNIFGEEIKSVVNKVNKPLSLFWSNETNFKKLIKAMSYYDEKENIDLSLPNLTNLLDFHNNLKSNLLNPNQFKIIKNDYFYKNYVKSIKCIPSYQHFGFEEFFLYIYPTDIYAIDFKILLTNTFQKIKYPACIDSSNSLFIKYIMPYRFPNKKYINWLTKAKKDVREYIAFSIRKIYRIFHFNTNLTSNGWDYDTDKFKIYMQNILFDPDYNIPISGITRFKLDEISDLRSFTPDSNEYKSLTQIYSWHSIDLKSYVGAKSYSMESHIQDLLKKKLIFPYLSLKNLGLQNTIFIILPHLKTETISVLIKIFNFFNIGFIYEIEGEFFISGFDNEIKFENGLMIKLCFPKCEIGEFEKLFDLLFEYLDISHYIILNDLVDGSNLIKSTFGNLDFLKTYNPLKNLKWNKIDKIWRNHNIFSKEHGFIYPDLI